MINNTSRKQTFLFSILVLSTLAFSTFYSQLSPGGEGLSIAYNAIVWIAALFVICSGVFQIILKNKIHLPKYWLGIAALPIGIIISGFIIEPAKPVEWLIRIGYILGGYLFFIALFQFEFKRHSIENILYTLCIAGSFHSLITLTQIMGWHFTHLIPLTADNSPISFFQQININASYLTTCFFLALYLASSSSISKRSFFLKAVLALTIFLTTSVLLAISSRTTLVAFSISLPLIIFARYRNFKRTKHITLILLASFIMGIGAGAYLSKGFAKYETKLDTQRQHARLFIYDLSWDIFKQKPLLGHGLGQFEKTFQEAKITYPDSNKLGGQKFSHPHNEFLFWMIEGGLVSIIGILIAMLTTCKMLLGLGLKKACTYIALIFPISFHTQVELPFYLSSTLWFIWITFLFLIHRCSQKEVNVNLSVMMQKLIIGSTMISSVMIITFLFHSLVALSGIVSFVSNSPAKFEHLKTADQNMYFQDISKYLMLTKLLYRDIATKNTDFTPLFIQWAETYTIQYPTPNVFTNLALAYWYMEEKQKALDTISKAYKMYPNTQHVQERYLEIKNNIPIEKFKQKIRLSVSRNPSPAKAENMNK